MACGKNNNFCSNKLFYTNPFAAAAATQNDDEMIIASGTFNLKDIAANALTWASGCTAANTAPSGVVITMAANDTYTTQSIAEVLGTFQLTVDLGGAPDPLDYLRWRVNGVDVVNFLGQSLPNAASVVAYVIANTLNGWTAEIVSGTTIQFYAPVGSGASLNGMTMVETQGIDGGSIPYSGLTAISGGVTAESTAFQLELDSIEILFAGGSTIKDVISTLVIGKILSLATRGEGALDLYSNTGDWALPVTQGTLNDFRVNVYIIGIQLP